ncbi:MAG: polysaccharide deacetylase family protein [Flavobacterium sp.]|nr:MAG: polysaccharide deacetylase family protein [Flavobacterium sp.]
MYHDVAPSTSEGLVISVIRLEEQLKWLSENKYRSWHFSELKNLSTFPGTNNVVITFDDAYVSFKDLAVPLLQKYDLKATLFVPMGYLGKTDEWYSGKVDIMNAQQLHSLEPDTVELGYHSFQHGKYNELTPEEIAADTQRALEVVKQHQLPLSPALAYPYGKFPRDKESYTKFVEYLKQQRFIYGLRIGNRLNKFPFPDAFKIQRLDIKGEYGLEKFRRKIKYGKLL